jgi:hypothetical protein
MAGIYTHEGIALVANDGEGLQIDTFKTRIEVVKRLISSGSLGAGCFGDKKHKAALREIQRHITDTRKHIAIAAKGLADAED